MARDLYEILMVHPRAEAIIIEAAYRRLAREYHPDVNKSPGAHEKMVEVNAAFEVLSDPAKRRMYDLTNIRAATAPTSDHTAKPRGSTRSTYQTKPEPDHTSSRYSDKRPPLPPNPSDFGITANYYDYAMEGAREWKKRKPSIPVVVQVLWVIMFVSFAELIFMFGSNAGKVGSEMLVIGWWSAIISGIPLASIMSYRDNSLRRQVFEPKYNPNPNGYLKYAQAMAEYETSIRTVYASRNWIIHFDSSCSGMVYAYSLPKWESEGHRMCAKCGHFTVRPRLLPRPFGPAPVPDT